MDAKTNLLRHIQANNMLHLTTVANQTEGQGSRWLFILICQGMVLFISYDKNQCLRYFNNQDSQNLPNLFQHRWSQASVNKE